MIQPGVNELQAAFRDAKRSHAKALNDILNNVNNRLRELEREVFESDDEDPDNADCTIRQRIIALEHLVIPLPIVGQALGDASTARAGRDIDQNPGELVS